MHLRNSFLFLLPTWEPSFPLLFCQQDTCPGPSPRERLEGLGRCFSSICTSTETGVFLFLRGTSWNGKAQADFLSWRDRHLPPLPSCCPADTELNGGDQDSTEREKGTPPSGEWRPEVTDVSKPLGSSSQLRSLSVTYCLIECCVCL